MSEGAVVKKSEAAVAGWESSGVDIGEPQAGTVAIVAREDTELKAAIVSAKRFPRDEAVSYTRIMKACDRPSMAEDATYAFPRGKKKNTDGKWVDNVVEGPSVYLAREAARCWGNIRSGLRIVEINDDQVHIRGYALDLETNAYVEAEDRFAKLVQRKRGERTEWVQPDERDLRELVNRRGAICVRNAILQVLPSDIVEEAVRRAKKTLQAAAKGDLEQNRDDAIRRLILAFDRFGVRGDMVAELLGHDLSLITPDELAMLRGVYKSIEDGNTKASDHFNFPTRDAAGDVDLNARIRQQAKPPEPKADAATEQKTDGGMRKLYETALAKHRPDLAGDDPDTKFERDLWVKEQTGKEAADLTREDHKKLIDALQATPHAGEDLFGGRK